MLDLLRLIRPGARLRRDRKVGSALRVRADLLGREGDVAFVAGRRAKQIHCNGAAVLLDVQQDDKVYFTYPHVPGFKRAPEGSAIPLRGGAQYLFSGSVDVLGGSQVSAVLVYFDGDRKLGHKSTLLTTGTFSLAVETPLGARQAVLGFRVKGPACFAVHSLSLTEVPQGCGPALTQGRQLYEISPTEAPQIDLTAHARAVVMIVLNDIAHDGRVLKTAQTLIDHGYRVTLLGMWRTQHSALTAARIAGAPALIFPNPTSFLRNSPVRALNWEHTIAYLRATMWRYVEQAEPRFIHTHDYHAVPLGFEFVRRLRALGREVDWLHDFHEYVPGYDHMEPDWQEAILAHEDRAVPAMDHRFTVSPLIATWLEERHGLEAAPTVVLNAPSRAALSVEFDRTARGDLGLDEDADLIIYSGGVSELRGLHTVVEALAADPGWHLALVTNNTGPYIARLEQIATAGGYRDRLHLLPYVEPHQVTAYVRDASIGIMPFRRYGNTDASLPNKLYDYLHAGLPMVASNCTLIEAFLEKWQIGEVFEEGNVRGCAETITRVLARQALYRDHIRAHPELLRAYTWEEQSKKIVAAYEVLERAPSLESRAALIG